jgi:hypothetical protein
MTQRSTIDEADQSLGMLAELRDANEELAKQGISEIFESDAMDDAARCSLMDALGDVGDPVRQKYAWACPDTRALNILAECAPLCEIGAGHGYWAHCLRERGVDINAYDLIGCANVEQKASAGGKRKKAKVSSEVEHRKASAEAMGVDVGDGAFWTHVDAGGPEALLLPANRRRALFLCFPDEIGPLGLECLRTFVGSTVVFVGELPGSTLSMEDAPWGRSATRDFHVQLMTKFHCVLRAALPTWPTGRESISVWKRSAVCPLLMPDDSSSDEDGSEHEGSNSAALGKTTGVAAKTRSNSDDGHDESNDESSESIVDSEGDENDEGFPGSTGGTSVQFWRHIPEDERLPVDAAAPCMAYLL